MLVDICKNCEHVRWLIAYGYGVRCGHPNNKEFSEGSEDSIPLISKVPEDCKNYEKKC